MTKTMRFYLILLAVLCNITAFAVPTFWKPYSGGSLPAPVNMPFHPQNYLVFQSDNAALKMFLNGLSSIPAEGELLSLPLPDGNYRTFRVWETPSMEPLLAAKYNTIKTFTGVAVDNATVTAKLDYTLFGFHAMIFDAEKTSFIDPYDNLADGFYFAHYRRDEVRNSNEKMACEVAASHNGADEVSTSLSTQTQVRTANRYGNGWQLRTYRLALSANSYYCQAATGLSSPTIAQCLSVMTTSLNRINGVYEKEFSVHMNLCNNEDTLIWNLASGGPNGSDPFRSINNNGNACCNANQTQCDNRIGNSNYDIGHVFTTGGGGISGLGIVCTNSAKAGSCTGSPTPVGDGFDIDYVAHEMGHEFGSEHTFNNDADGSCSGNAVSSRAYEPGSGATIMDYGGICSPDDLQNGSDAYFSISSLQQIQTYLGGNGGRCPVNTSTGNKLVYLPTFTASYTIPYKTPFELTSPVAIDSVADTSTTYCWAQYNLGDFGKRFVNTFLKGPIFRSYFPVKTPTRVFPKNSMVLAGSLSNAGVDGNQGEKAPDTARFLTFKLVVRNILNGTGCFLIPDDTIHLDAVSNATKRGFKVTSQGTTGVSYTGGSTQTVTWDVVSTNVSPVSCANVTIYMSKDGGNTWPYTIGNFPNTGTASVIVPNPSATTALARFKVKGTGNVFFNVNSKNFTVTYNSSLPISTTATQNVASAETAVRLFPVPASSYFNVETGSNSPVAVRVLNTVGQQVWTGTAANRVTVDVQSWPRGIYYVQLHGEGIQIVKSITVE